MGGDESSLPPVEEYDDQGLDDFYYAEEMEFGDDLLNDGGPDSLPPPIAAEEEYGSIEELYDDVMSYGDSIEEPYYDDENGQYGSYDD